jgi:hypothetical protein
MMQSAETVAALDPGLYYVILLIWAVCPIEEEIA